MKLQSQTSKNSLNLSTAKLKEWFSNPKNSEDVKVLWDQCVELLQECFRTGEVPYIECCQVLVAIPKVSGGFLE